MSVREELLKRLLDAVSVMDDEQLEALVRDLEELKAVEECDSGVPWQD